MYKKDWSYRIKELGPDGVFYFEVTISQESQQNKQLVGTLLTRGRAGEELVHFPVTDSGAFANAKIKFSSTTTGDLRMHLRWLEPDLEQNAYRFVLHFDLLAAGSMF